MPIWLKVLLYLPTIVLGIVAIAVIRGKRIERAVKRHLIAPHVVADDEAGEIFSGRVEPLTDKLLKLRAGTERKKQYYSGAPLKWDVIAADADIRNELEAEILEKHLADLPKSLQVICIVGESGAGKSTLAWRLAARIHREYGRLVLRVLDREDPDVWYRLVDFAYLVKEPFCVLADDLFRNPDVVRAVSELRPDLPITVLATSQSHEYSTPRLAVMPSVFRVGEPGQRERKQALALLGIDPAALTAEQIARMNSASDLWVLMTELTGGAGLDEIISDSLSFLRQKHPAVHRAYEYLCFAYSLGVAVPVSVMARLDEQGRFHNLPDQAGAKGLIFYDEEGSTRIRPGHQRRAQSARRIYEKTRGSSAVLQELVRVVDPTDAAQRLFLSILMNAIFRNEQDLLGSVKPMIEESVSRCVASVERIAELAQWRQTWTRLGRYDEADRCVDRSLALAPVTEYECILAIGLLRRRGREQQALPLVNNWIREHPDHVEVRAAQIKLLNRYGSEDYKARSIGEIGEWLSRNERGTDVRIAYIKLVERAGSPEQIDELIGQTRAWLIRHGDASDVRTVYFGLVERRGTAVQLSKAIEEAVESLATGAADNVVWTALLGLVERKGTAHQLARVIAETEEALESGVAGNDVRTAFVALIERSGTEEQVQRVITDTERWLASHEEAQDVRTMLMSIIDRRGSPEQVARAIVEQRKWAIEHPRATDVGVKLVSMLRRRGRTEEAGALIQKLAAANPTDSAFAAHFMYVALEDVSDRNTAHQRFNQIAKTVVAPNLLLAWAQWLEARKFDSDAENVYGDLTSRFPRIQPYSYRYGRFLLSRRRYSEAEVQFRRVLKIHRGHQMAHDGLGQALMGLSRQLRASVGGGASQTDVRQSERYWAEAEKELASAVFWSAKNAGETGPLLNNLGWYYVESERFSEAICAFSRAIEEGTERVQDFGGLGHALAGLGRWAEAADALRTALAATAEPSGSPAADDIQRLLERCEAKARSAAR